MKRRMDRSLQESQARKAANRGETANKQRRICFFRPPAKRVRRNAENSGFFAAHAVFAVANTVF